MFSENGKISERQLRLMLVLPIFAGGVFVIPYLGAYFWKQSVLVGLLVFMFLALLYVSYLYEIPHWYMFWCRNRKLTKINESEKKQKGIFRPISKSWQERMDKWIEPSFCVIQFVRNYIRLLFYLVLSLTILQEAQVPFMRAEGNGSFLNRLILLPLLIVAVYGAKQSVKRSVGDKKVWFPGIEKQGRLQEMTIMAVLVPYLTILIFGISEAQGITFLPQLNRNIGELVICGYLLLTFLLPVENYVYLKPYVIKKKSPSSNEKKRTGYWCVLGMILFVILSSLLVIDIYGVNGAATEEMVTIGIMRYIRLPFGVLERFDVLMVWFLMSGCFILICNTIYFASIYLKRLLKNSWEKFVLPVVLVTSWLALQWLPDYKGILSWFLQYGAFVDVPLSLVLPYVGLHLIGGDTCDE